MDRLEQKIDSLLFRVRLNQQLLSILLRDKAWQDSKIKREFDRIKMIYKPVKDIDFDEV